MSDFSRTIVVTRTLQMFPVLGPAEIERVRRFGVPHRFDDGSALVLAGAAGHGLEIILSGEVDVSQLRQSSVREFITTHGPGAFMGELVVNVAGSKCEPPSTAQAYVFNATVLPSGDLGYLTLWPDGETQPGVSTLNAADGTTTSNMAIVPNIDGKTDAYAYGTTTQLLLDIAAYFAP